MQIQNATSPTTSIVTLAEAKVHLRVDADITVDDATIQLYIDAVSGWSEEYCRCKFRNYTMDFFIDADPQGSDLIEFPFGGLLLVDADALYLLRTTDIYSLVTTMPYEVVYKNPGGGLAAGIGGVRPTAGHYWSEEANVSGRMTDVVKITSVDFGPKGGVVPPPVKSDVLLFTGHLYANRESVVIGTIATMVPMGVEFLLSPYRLFRFM